MKSTALMRNLPMVPGRIIEDGSAIIEEELRGSVPVRTGTLRGSVRREVVGDLEAVISTNSGYGRYVNEGTRPHVIRAKGDGMLRFEVGGIVMYRKEVQHPGFAGRWFTRTTVQRSMPRIMALVREALGNIMQGRAP